TLTAARDLASRGIRVVSIAPGLFETPMLGLVPGPTREALVSVMASPRRFGETPESSYRLGYPPLSRRATIWSAVGAFASKSRLTAALSWPTVSNTEKSSRGHALLGNTNRPCRLMTKSFVTTVYP